ncbi:hypothetical protein IT882_13015 [Microbacterium schleiferi]|uniref:Uncharacterized protein n=1 Tax=Microbacterium schleiferi TaxID=69362 RepID=A0A7S8MWT2_9MICO|nr:hypothetical protein [Microbacterium schleiferi]QPE04113.1 hypothetical protein IT882_13015 [Microbacterium schleiferi]
MDDGPKVRTKPGPSIPLPPSWMEADVVWAALREVAFRADEAGPVDRLDPYHLGVHDTVEGVAAKVETCVAAIRADDRLLALEHTARLAVAYYRAAQVALRKFPFAEERHAVAYAVCRDCGMRSLERRPPLTYLEPITVKCRNPACGAVFHPALVEYDLQTYREEIEAKAATA